MEAGLEFVGAAGTVTGSKTILRSSRGTAVVDFGMFQGLKQMREENRRPFPVPPAEIDGLALTHAHIDHSGLLPKLAADGYRNQIATTGATAQLLEILLRDAAKIQVEDADRANRHGYSKHHPALPLYTEQDAEQALRLVRSYPRATDIEIAPGITMRFRLAGHILGSSWIDATVDAGGGSVRAVFTGDLGPRHSQIMPPPEPLEAADVLVIESTYGDRDHSTEDPRAVVRQIVSDAVARRSVIVVPAFAVDRTEDLLYLIRQLETAGEIPEIPVWLDSPMATSVLEIYREHGEELAQPLRDAMRGGADPLHPAMLQVTRTSDESKKLNALTGPAVIIASSGMATGGRVLHHLKRRLPDAETLVLFCGYQAAGTRGRSLVDGASTVRIQGEQVPVKARIQQLHSLSSHADRTDMLAWLSGLKQAPSMVFPVHGEAGPREAIAELIRRELGWKVSLPEPGTVASFASLR